MNTIQTGWENITHKAPGGAIEARTRLTAVFDDDPCVAMLSPQIRACMVEAFVRRLAAPAHDKPEDAISAYDHTSMKRDLARVVQTMPLGFMGADFAQHLLSLVLFTIIPFPKYDDWHRPI